MSFRHWTAALAVLPFLISCSVKEDRILCPGGLLLDLSGVQYSALEADGCESLIVVACMGDCLITDMVPVEDAPASLLLKVPKGEVGLTVFAGANLYFSASKGVYVPLGQQASRLLRYTARLWVRDEEQSDSVALHKDYCLLKMKYSNGQGYSLQVVGSVNGSDLGGCPSDGAFRYTSTPDDSGICEVVLPRQNNDDLLLNVVDGPRILKGFQLGKMLANSGYDWQAEDLSDISLTVDYSRMILDIKAGYWSDSIEFELTI